MKKIIRIALAVASVLFITALILIPVKGVSGTKDRSGKTSGGGKTLSEDVIRITVKSCENCHAEPGNPFALSHVNLSFWEKFAPEKQADKAKAMCDMVTMNKMPPKKYLKNHPDDALIPEDINKICDWAQSLQIKVK
jgi:hypothetical protein